MHTELIATAHIDTSLEFAWECITNPKHITKWAIPGDAWKMNILEYDLQVGGNLEMNAVLASRDVQHSMKGTFLEIISYKKLHIELNSNSGEKESTTYLVEKTQDGFIQVTMIRRISFSDVHDAYQNIVENIMKNLESYVRSFQIPKRKGALSKLIINKFLPKFLK